MSLHPIQQVAFEYASGARQRETKAKAEKASLQDRIAQLELEIENHKAAADRLTSFSVHSNGVYQCPRCWIVQEIAADLTPIGDDNGNDVFRCAHCRDEFVVPA